MKSREFFSSSGVPESEQNPFLEKERDKILREPERNPEFDKYLDAIDMDAIKSSLFDLLKRSDVDPESFNFLGRDKIVFNHEDGLIGSYQAVLNIIGINPELMAKRCKEIGLPIKMTLLDTVVHEQIHGISKLTCRGVMEAIEVESVLKDFSHQSGYSLAETKHEGGKAMNSTFFELFEEGVTELLSRRTVREYLKSHKDYASPEEIAEYIKIMDDDSVRKSYDLSVSFVEAFIEKLAHQTGVSKDTVWGAVLRGKFEGEDMTDPEFGVLAAGVFDAGMLERLAVLNHPSQDFSMIRLMEKMDISVINPELWDRIEKRISAVSKARQEDKRRIDSGL